MTRLLTAIDIVNAALDEIKETAINSITSPEVPKEAICARHYDESRVSVLEQGLWNFSIAREEIARTGTPVFGYTDKYTLPSYCVRLLGVHSTEGNKIRDYEIEGGCVLVNNNDADSLYIAFVKDIKAVGSWPSLFKRVVILELAVRLGYVFSAQKSLVEYLEWRLEKAFLKASASDGQQNPIKRYERSRWIEKRLAYGRRYASDVSTGGFV